MIVSGDPDVASDRIALTDDEAQVLILEQGEFWELSKAVWLFVENYRKMHAGTLYAPRVDAAAKRMHEKLLEL